MFTNSGSVKGRFLAAGVHFAASLALALLAAVLVFWVWYPYPYRYISGGRELFLLVVSVDVIMGPLLTLAVFSPLKKRSTLAKDLAVIAILQVAALAYGLWTVSVARPVHLVYEIDRFRVVHAIDVPDEMLARAPDGMRALPFTGPTLLSVRDFKSSNENFEATMAALQGLALSARPDLWQSYEKAQPQIRARAKPVAELKARFPARAAEIDEALKSIAADKHPAESLGYIPMVGRSTFWTVLVDRNTTEVLAFVPIDSF